MKSMKRLITILLLMSSGAIYGQSRLISKHTNCGESMYGFHGGFENVMIITGGCDSGKIIITGDTLKAIEELVEQYQEQTNMLRALESCTNEFNLPKMYVIWDDASRRDRYKKLYDKYAKLKDNWRRKYGMCPYTPYCGVDHFH